jgi:hypothetical protein
MAKIRPDIEFRRIDPKNIKNPISYIGFKGTVSFEEVSSFFKKIFKRNKNK